MKSRAATTAVQSGLMVIKDTANCNDKDGCAKHHQVSALYMEIPEYRSSSILQTVSSKVPAACKLVLWFSLFLVRVLP